MRKRLCIKNYLERSAYSQRKILIYFQPVTLVFIVVVGFACRPQPKPCKPQERYLVVHTLAGMANRLRTVASAQIMAEVTNRKLLINWEVIPEELPGMWRDFFRNPLPLFSGSALEQSGCTLNVLANAPKDDPVVKNLGLLNNPEGYKRLLSVPLDQEPIVFFETSLDFKPDAQFLSDHDYNQKYMRFYRDLQPNAWIVQQVEAFKTQHNLNSYFMVGVHYRAWQTGKPDVEQNPNLDPTHKYVNAFITEMEKAWNLPAHERANKAVAFFLATDNKEVKKRIMSHAKFAGQVFSRDIEIDRTTVRGQESALVDFFLLGLTNFIIGTNESSFSDEAGHLTTQNRKISIGPKIYN